MSTKDQRTLTGVYTHAPMEMLTHCIQAALVVACAMFERNSGRALVTIMRDEALAGRAAALIMRNTLRMMVDREDPTPAAFDRLVKACTALASED